ELVALVIPEGNLGRGRAGQLGRLVREGTQNLAQFQRGRELVRDVEQRLKPVCRSHTGLIGIRSESLERGYDHGVEGKEEPCMQSPPTRAAARKSCGTRRFRTPHPPTGRCSSGSKQRG